MGVLTRRIEELLSLLESGKIVLPAAETSECLAELKRDLEKIRRLPTGEIDLKTCTPLVRHLSRTILSTKKFLDHSEKPPAADLPDDISPKRVIEAQREYFQLVSQFFEETTETRAELFGKYDSFGDSIRRDAKNIGTRMEKTLPDFIAAHQRFCGENSSILLNASKIFSGMNAVVGGSSAFPDSAFNGYRKMALYADTVFIPDPILPWLEVGREHEGFWGPRLLEACHDVLRLLPLANAELPHPAVLVFPSWEKTLEENDSQTMDGIGELSLSFFSHYLGTRFEDESEILEFIQGTGKEAFRAAVNRHALFIPPQCKTPMSVDEGIKYYHEYLQAWRTKSYCAKMARLSPEVLVCLSIMERLAPQYHIRDNARMTSAQPLLWHPTHYHYFHLCATATAEVLEQEAVIDPKTVALLAALNRPALSWLGNVSIDDLVRLRAENANEKFRTALSKHLGALNETDPAGVNRIAADVARGIASLISEHSDNVRKLWEDYKKKLALDGGLVVTAGIALSPWLSSMLGVLPGVAAAAAGGSIFKNFVGYQMDKRVFAKSVMGILSSAKNDG
jgi:hypothetical protein